MISHNSVLKNNTCYKRKEPIMKKCLTTKLVFKEASGCLVEKPECGFAHKFGFSFVCRHPDHTKYHAHVAGAMTGDEALEMYETLRQKRRNEYVASLDEGQRRYFCLESDFHGQTLTNMDLNKQY
jgi:hypothetical protein